jgi:predicted nucleic acid-binding protein
MKKFGNILKIIIGHEISTNANTTIYTSWPLIVREAFSLGRTEFSERLINDTVLNSKIREIDREKMIVEVKHAGWIQILSAKQHDLLNIIHEKYGTVQLKKIVFVLSRVSRETIK